MAIKAHVKSCGHSGCTLNTPQCCGCEDTRPIATFYPCYIDGLGYTTDNEAQTRFKDYCPPCRDQFERLTPGMKRCGCGVVRCDLTTQKCCACLDQRPVRFKTSRNSEFYQNFVDSQFWEQYCASCKLRLSSPSENKKSAEPRTKVKPAASHRTAILTGTTLNTKASPSLPQDPELVVIDITDALERTAVVPISESAVKNGQREVIMEIGDADDYEIVLHSDLIPSQGGQDICAAMGRSVAAWFHWR